MAYLVLLFWLVLLLLPIISYWKLFELAGQSGFAIIIPIYNLYIMTEIAGLEWWWVFLPFLSFLIPYLGPIIMLGLFYYIVQKFVESYGKDSLFALGAFLLPFVFLPILAFDSKTKYLGPSAKKEKHHQQPTNNNPDFSHNTTKEEYNFENVDANSQTSDIDNYHNHHTNNDPNNFDTNHNLSDTETHSDINSPTN